MTRADLTFRACDPITPLQEGPSYRPPTCKVTTPHTQPRPPPALTGASVLPPTGDQMTHLTDTLALVTAIAQLATTVADYLRRASKR